MKGSRKGSTEEMSAPAPVVRPSTLSLLAYPYTFTLFPENGFLPAAKPRRSMMMFGLPGRLSQWEYLEAREAS